LFGALEQLDIFFRNDGGAVFLEDIDQAFDFLFHFASGQTLFGAQVFVDHLHSPLGILIGDADNTDLALRDSPQLRAKTTSLLFQIACRSFPPHI
jgi:hypothetical protein